MPQIFRRVRQYQIETTFPTRVLPRPNVTATITATSVETGDDALIEVFVGEEPVTPAAIADAHVTINESEAIGGGEVSIGEESD